VRALASVVAATAVLVASSTLLGPGAMAVPKCNVPNPPPACDGGGGGGGGGGGTGGGGDPMPPPVPAMPSVAGFRSETIPKASTVVYYQGGGQPTQLITQQYLEWPDHTEWFVPHTIAVNGPLPVGAGLQDFIVVTGSAIPVRHCYRARFTNDGGSSPWWSGCGRQSPAVGDINWVQFSSVSSVLSWVDHSSSDRSYMVTEVLASQSSVGSAYHSFVVPGDGATVDSVRILHLNGLSIPVGEQVLFTIWSVDDDNVASWLNQPLINQIHATFIGYNDPPA
jgi:hypothetical protein